MENIIDHTENDEEGNEFYFESDQLALRNNSDYAAVLKALIILESQRNQALKDLDTLSLLEKQALENPIEFVKNISNIENLPTQLKIAEIPNINFEKYDISFPHMHTNNKQKVDTIVNRIIEQNPSDTHNKPWTSEEQRRLEELLIEYPPEQYEMRRFAKISHAIGNRTTKQVASRVQKFFKKLHSAGMPIPGRIPKAQRFLTKYRYNKQSFRQSSFFPAHDVPVTMPEDDNTDFFFESQSSTSHMIKSSETENEITDKIYVAVDSDSDDSESDQLQLNNKARAIQLLDRVKRDKNYCNQSSQHCVHIGYKCEYCSEYPIKGTRWSCNSCQPNTVNYCSDCFVLLIISGNIHSIYHHFSGLRVLTTNTENEFTLNHTTGDIKDSVKPIHCIKLENTDQNSYDEDYMLYKFSKTNEYNYLDPNFLPQ